MNSQNSLEELKKLNPAFDRYFQSVYKDRWPVLFAALAGQEVQVKRQNRFIEDHSDLKPDQMFLNLEDCRLREKPEALVKNEQGLFIDYIMDPASVIVARQLQIEKEQSVLDLCAAPGGKSLILAEKLSYTGSLVLNEMSNTRRQRLLSVVQGYIARENREFISVKGLDGNLFGLRNPETYDCILADVPCSGERHLLENKTEFAVWTEKRSKNLAIRQYSLLSSAWLALKTGGHMVYSTCSISPHENDEVIKKLVKKRSARVATEPNYHNPQWQLEKTEHGFQILPDKLGMGPMYFSILYKDS